MKASLEQVEPGSPLAGEAGNALQAITGAAAQVTTHVYQIAEVADNMTRSENELIGAVESVSAVVEEYSAITEEMAANSAAINADIEHVAGSSRKNSRVAENANQFTAKMALQVQLLANMAQGLGQLSKQLSVGTDRAVLHQYKQLEDQLLKKGADIATTTANVVGKAFERAIKQGILTEEDVFDTNYQPIPNTNPQKFHTAYDAFTDANVLALEDKHLADPDVVFAVAVDTNGYLPTHNSRFTQPLTGNYQTDLTGNRTKRVFDDAVGLAAGQNRRDILKQIYWRDTGEVMWDVSVPITVFGRHWGGMRVGLSMNRISEGTINAVRHVNIASLLEK